MTAVAFDTLKSVRTLRDKAKMSPEQAKGLADAVSEALQGDLTTKGDILALRAAIVGVRSEVEALRLSTRDDLAEAKADIIEWVIGAIGFQALVIVGAVVALSRGIH